MIRKLLNRLFERREIVNCDRDIYMTRWYLLRRPGVGIFLHRFERSDEDRALHDHPWAFFTFILWRGYYELTPYGRQDGFTNPKRRRKWPLMLCYRPATWCHRVELIDGKPAWTLVIRFRAQRDWGFWTRQGWQKWNEWWQEKCE